MTGNKREVPGTRGFERDRAAFCGRVGLTPAARRSAREGLLAASSRRRTIAALKYRRAASKHPSNAFQIGLQEFHATAVQTRRPLLPGGHLANRTLPFWQTLPLRPEGPRKPGFRVGDRHGRTLPCKFILSAHVCGRAAAGVGPGGLPNPARAEPYKLPRMRSASPVRW